MESMISKAFMLSGQDLPVLRSVKVHHPTIPEILNINDGILCEELYWMYVSTIMSDPYDYMVMLDDMALIMRSQTLLKCSHIAGQMPTWIILRIR